MGFAEVEGPDERDQISGVIVERVWTGRLVRPAWRMEPPRVGDCPGPLAEPEQLPPERIHPCKRPVDEDDGRTIPQLTIDKTTAPDED
jgi:hypothetical protein